MNYGDELFKEALVLNTQPKQDVYEKYQNIPQIKKGINYIKSTFRNFPFNRIEASGANKLAIVGSLSGRVNHLVEGATMFDELYFDRDSEFYQNVFEKKIFQEICSDFNNKIYDLLEEKYNLDGSAVEAQNLNITSNEFRNKVIGNFFASALASICFSDDELLAEYAYTPFTHLLGDYLGEQYCDFGSSIHLRKYARNYQTYSSRIDLGEGEIVFIGGEQFDNMFDDPTIYLQSIGLKFLSKETSSIINAMLETSIKGIPGKNGVNFIDCLYQFSQSQKITSDEKIIVRFMIGRLKKKYLGVK